MKILWSIAQWSMYITVSILIPVLVMSVEKKTATVKTINMPQIPLWSLGLWFAFLIVVSCFFISRPSQEKKEEKKEEKEEEKKETPPKAKKAAKKETTTFSSIMQIMIVILLMIIIFFAMKWLNIYQGETEKPNIASVKTETKEKVKKVHWQLGWGKKDEKRKNNMFELPSLYNLWFDVETNKIDNECLDFYILSTNKPLQKIHFVLNRVSNEKVPKDEIVWFGNYTNIVSGRYGTVVLKKETDTQYVGKAKFTGGCEKPSDIVIRKKR